MPQKSIKFVVTVVLVLSYFFLPKYGFTSSISIVSGGSLIGNLLYPISHANIYHLLANILCLWMLRCPLHLFATYTIAVLCSFLPSFSLFDFLVGRGTALAEPTYGFSGVLFAMVGISWGRVHRFRDMLSRNKWILIIPAFVPHINFLIHLYCLLLGYAYGIIQKSRNPEIPKKSCAKK